MAFRAKEFKFSGTPDSINSWFRKNPDVKVIATYDGGGFVGIIYEGELTEDAEELI